MITIGYCTVPEVLLLFETNGKSLSHLTAAMLNGELRVYVQVPLQYDWEICRVPREDLLALSEQNWEEWLPRGRVPEPQPDPIYEAAHKAYLEDMLSLPRPQRKPVPEIIERYERRRLLLSEQELNRWLGNGETKTGAPGRPTSMHVALAEFERRKQNGLCEGSRDAEAKTLAAWLEITHPEYPHLSAKTIRNKLPANFQPFKGTA